MREAVTSGRSLPMVPKSPWRKTTLTRSKSASSHSATASMGARFKRYILRRVGTHRRRLGRDRSSHRDVGSPRGSQRVDDRQFLKEGPSQYCSACFLPFCPRCGDGCGLAAELRLKNNYLRVSALANEAGKCLFCPWMT